MPIVHLSASLFTGPKPMMLAIPFPPGPLTTVKFGALPLHTIQCCTIAHHQLR
ncbi:ferredoxin [Escherichia coli O111:NM str. 01-3076]|nr:ferredoxin [Escherichia coli O111:NM str. 01-3076]